MRSIRYSLLIGSAALAFASCSGARPLNPSAFSSMPQAEHVVSAASLGEVLKASKIAVKTSPCIKGQSGGGSFTANGTASGPNTGKLIAKGAFNFFHAGGQSLWTFSETFKITGAHSTDGTITGNGKGNTATCTTFGPVTKLGVLKYHLGMASGSATTNLMKNGSSLLEKLH